MHIRTSNVSRSKKIKIKTQSRPNDDNDICFGAQFATKLKVWNNVKLQENDNIANQ